MLRSWVKKGALDKVLHEGFTGSFLLGVGRRGPGCKAEVFSEFPLLTRRLNDFLASYGEVRTWTSLRVGRNVGEAGNPENGEEPLLPVWLVTLGDFRGGGLWVQGTGNSGSVLRSFGSEGWLSGEIWDLKGSPLKVAAGLERCLDPWVGEELWVLKAFTHFKIRS